MSSGAEIRKSVLQGIAWSIATWIVYGLVETVLSISIRLWRFREMEVLPWQWPLILTLLATYAGTGILAGAVGGLFLAFIHHGASYRVFAALTIALTFGANLIAAWPLARSEQIALAVTAVLIAGFTAALFSNSWHQRMSFLSGPWTVSLLLLSVPWVSREFLAPSDSSVKKTGLSILFLCAIIVLATLANSFWQQRAFTAFGQFGSAAAAFAIFSAAVLIWQKYPSVNPGVRPSRASVPNVVLIVMDTVRADHVSAYGYARDTTPNLRNFSRTATTYSSAIAASDFTLGTHATMFTGLYPDWNGAVQSNSPQLLARPLGDQNSTLAEVLRAHGYWTVESAANSGFLAPWTGLTRGFAVSDLNRPVGLSDIKGQFYLREFAKRRLGLVFETGAFDRPSRIADDVNRRALGFLDVADQNHVPFFLFINYMDAHTPYVPAPPFDRQFASPGEVLIDAATLRDVKLKVDSERRQLANGESLYLIRKYDGGIASEDAAIADVLVRLRKLGLFDNTLIIVTADHGDTFGEHGLMDHFIGFVYQELVHVPLLIKYPGQHEARRSKQLVSQVDLMPTVLDALGINTGLKLQGRSLLKSSPEDITVFSRGTPSPDFGLGNPHFSGLRRAIFSGDLKLIQWTAGSPELYDLASDPQEQHNLYTDKDPRARELTRRLDSWVASFPRLTSGTRKIDPSVTERLKSLGYVQ
jgi:arylsulfatase A-like enzyme